ncbi:MAG: hypothetical protein C0391_03755 [Anaerolinea sp.]|nr:hypothetical protein [Anaerolinea sp.]
MKFEPLLFKEFVEQKFSDWRGKRLSSLNEFGKFLGVSSQVISNWYNGKLKQPPAFDQCKLLIEKYGFEAYEVLGLPVPGLSPENSSLLLAASRELNRSSKELGIDIDDPEFVKVFTEVFSRFGLKVNIMD